MFQPIVLGNALELGEGADGKAAAVDVHVAVLVADEDFVAGGKGLDLAVELGGLGGGAVLVAVAEGVVDRLLLLVAVLPLLNVLDVLVDGESRELLGVVALVGAEGGHEAARLVADALEGRLDLVDRKDVVGGHGGGGNVKVVSRS